MEEGRGFGGGGGGEGLIHMQVGKRYSKSRGTFSSSSS